MRVLYVSKASRVAAHREKLMALASRADVTLVTPRRWGSAPFEDAPFDASLDMIRLPAFLHGQNHLHLYRGIRKILDAGGYHLLHVDEEPYSLVTAGLVRLAHRARVPTVFFQWQNLRKRLPPPFGALQKYVFARAAGGIAGTLDAARVLRAAGFGGPVLVSPQMGVSEERFRPDAAVRRARRAELGLGDGTPLVGYVGRVVREKGLDLLVRALPEVRQAHVIVVGDGPEMGALRQLAERLGVSGRVHHAGGVPSLEVPRWMAALDVLALPSRTTPGWAEQFGRVLVEAMACEVPVVASDSGAIPEVVDGAGRIVPEASVGELARALGELLADPRERRRLGRLGRARVLERFTHQRVVDAQVVFYGAVVDGRRPGRPGGGRARPNVRPAREAAR